jgi:cephalosporin-C deacetylase-like acetyl esterase
MLTLMPMVKQYAENPISSRTSRSFLLVLVSAAVSLAAEPSPLLVKLNVIAQSQLDARALTIAGIQNVAAAEQRKTEVRARILQLLGGLPNYRGPLNPKVTRVIERDGYVIENLMLESLPDYYVTANLYRPKSAGKHPAVLFSLGHWDGGKAAAQLIGANLALKGFVALAYDPVGQGERQQAYDARLGHSLIGGPTDQHFLNGAQAILIGQNVARYFVWDGMRAIDYLVSRPEVDSERIGASGCSGGGTQTTYIAALDPRVKAAAPACYMNSFRTLYQGSIGDSEQSLPGFLSAGLDQSDYVELFAPKPWLILSTEDDFFTPAGARQVYEEAKRWYGLYGVEDRIKWVVGPGEHGTPRPVREAMYEWMIRWLQDGKGDAREQAVSPVPDHDLFVTEHAQVSGRELFQIIAAEPRQSGTQEELRTFLAGLMARNKSLVLATTVLPSTAGAKRKPAIVLVQRTLEAGSDARRLVEEGNVVILVAPQGAGDGDNLLVGNWMSNTRAWLVGRNLPAMHAAAINHAVEIALQRPDVDPERISARATGVAGIWLLLASAVNPRIGKIVLDRTPSSLRSAIESPVHQNLHDAVIPGFALKWDLQDIRKLPLPREVVWRNPTDWTGNVVKVSGAFEYTSSDPNWDR